MVLDYIQDSLKYVPHERRKEIKLGEYMKRHQFMSAGQENFTQFADHILRSKIESTLGQMAELEKIEMIDWEYANARTNPSMHEAKDEKVKKALKEGKSYDENKEIDEYLNAPAEGAKHISDMDVKMVSTVNPYTGFEEQ
jgi:Icc-related predicted phosphoesterase